jgi:hypothetical protein
VKVARFHIKPLADGAFEDDSVAGVQEHLCPAAGHFVIGRPLVLLVDQPDVAYAFPNAVDFPWPSAGFVKSGSGNIPCDLGRHFHDAGFTAILRRGENIL